VVKLHTDKDIPARSLDIAVVGYGSQGRAQAQNLRDSGCRVRVALRPGPSVERAQADGFEVVPLGAATEAEVLALLLPDLAQPELLAELRPQLGHQTVLFAHGFTVHHGLAELPATCNVVLVAPKAPGKLVRDEYNRGRGVPCLIAVHQDASGQAQATALAYARALGGGRSGILETTFREETETDLFGEQAVLCGGVPELVVAGFETLVEAGYQPEVAYYECLHELKLIVDLLAEGGLGRMVDFVSETAAYGGLSRGPRVAGSASRQAMRDLLAEIRQGDFGREWLSEITRGGARHRHQIAALRTHPIEQVGERLRALMTTGGTP
jgi:ketol-acid reductoisomerase